MFSFFTSSLNAGVQTAKAFILGPSKTVEEMQSAQNSRYHTFANLLSSLTYTEVQTNSRKQYWCGQTFFLAQFITRHSTAIKKLTGSPPSLESDIRFIKVIQELLSALDNLDNLKLFIELLNEDNKTIKAASLESKTLTYPNKVLPQSLPREVNLVNGDVIQLINTLHHNDVFVVTDDAPNSHRDGAAKYSNGSVEELLSRYGDSALKMVTHFCDVHERNFETGQYAFSDRAKKINILEYQQRYLKMVLKICLKLLEKKEAYLNSKEFLNDLLHSEKNPDNGLPIYFDLQNNAYEVPVLGGYNSWHWFTDTKELTSVENIFSLLKDNPKPIKPIAIISYAAPDLRTLETSPLDTRATSNIYLQHSKKEGAMGDALTYGVKKQCETAIAQAKKYKEQGINKTVAAVFIMPGCGAFKNPEKATAAQFISAIKYYSQEFAELNISCYLAEYNKHLYQILQEANNSIGFELAALNETIINLTSPEVRAKAVAVKEKILALYADGEKPESLIKHLYLSKELLTLAVGPKRDALISEYQLNSQELSHQSNPLLRALGIAMLVLSAAVVAAGIALSIPGVIASGAVLSGAIGLGLFSSSKTTDLSTLSNDLVKQNPSAIN